MLVAIDKSAISDALASGGSSAQSCEKLLAWGIELVPRPA